MNLALRCSSLPLVFKCPPVAIPPAIRVESPDRDAANLGSAAHEALRDLVERGAIDAERLPEIAERFGVPLDDLDALCRQAWRVWPDLRAIFAGAETEVAMELAPDMGFALSGHTDAMSLVAAADGAEVFVLDWKTGRKDSDYSEQMRGYCALALDGDPKPKRATAIVVWLRTGEVERYSMTQEQLGGWAARVHHEIEERTDTFRPGSHCYYCPRSHECLAAHALAHRDVGAFIARGYASNLTVLSPSEKLRLHDEAKRVAKLADAVLDALKAYVETFGPIEADGVRLAISEERRRKLDATKAWPVLEATGFDDADFAASMTLSISKVEARLREKAGRGEGARAVRALNENLEAAGAVRFDEVRKLVERRA